MNKDINFAKQPPSYYAGDELHAIKQQKLQKALEKSGFDCVLTLPEGNGPPEEKWLAGSKG